MKAANELIQPLVRFETISSGITNNTLS